MTGRGREREEEGEREEDWEGGGEKKNEISKNPSWRTEFMLYPELSPISFS